MRENFEKHEKYEKQRKYCSKIEKTDKFKKIAINENIKAIIPEDATGELFLTQKGTNISIQHLNVVLKQIFKTTFRGNSIPF